ncbi:MAG: 16S rRNA (uracil(1498)-N(3))-methyltransferase [Thermodesulfobacteriota bacterium]
MRRFFVEDIDEQTRSARIAGAEFAHLKRVLRLRAGDVVALFNGKGLELHGTVEEVGRDFAEVTVRGRARESHESPVEVILLQGLLKGDKPEFIIQKATELGAAEVSFYTTARTVPLAPNRSKEARWRKVAIEAAKQCGRTVVTRVTVAGDLKDATAGREGFLKLALWEGIGEAGGMRDALRGTEAERVVVLVGPEGGFSGEDVEAAQREGFRSVGLGPRILRAETAAVAALTILQYELGDLDT